MTTTATTVNDITTHLFGDMARDALADLGFSHREEQTCFCYGALASIPHTMDTHGAILFDIYGEVCQVADASTPRAPVDLPFTGDEMMKPARAYGGAVWRNPIKEEAEEEERVWVDGYDSDTTLPIEGEYVLTAASA